MITTVNKFKVELQTLVEALEGSVNTFYWKDLNRAMAENSAINYPLVCAFKTTANITMNQNRLQVTIDVADKVYQDLTNLNDVESDTLNICRAIFNGMQSVRWKKIGRIESCSVRYFMLTNTDYVAGHSMTMDFNFRDLNGTCSQPFFDYDFDQVISGEAPTATVINSDLSYSQTVEPGDTLELPDITYTVKNSLNTTLVSAVVPSVNNISTTLPDVDNVDTDGSTVSTPAGVAFTCSAGADATSTSLPIMTSQTTTYVTGDDSGATKVGRLVDFFTLNENNYFGNTNRFTDTSGGTSYTNNLVCDWSTFEQSTGNFIMYYKLPQYLNDTQPNCIAFAEACTYGGYTNWHVWNKSMVDQLENVEATTSILNYAPFNIGNLNCWTSTRRATTGNPYLVNLNIAERYTSMADTFGAQIMLCRLANISEL